MEINLLEDEISDIEIVAGGLENDLRNLKEEYANMIYSTHKSNQGFSKLAFFFQQVHLTNSICVSNI